MPGRNTSEARGGGRTRPAGSGRIGHLLAAIVIASALASLGVATAAGLQPGKSEAASAGSGAPPPLGFGLAASNGYRIEVYGVPAKAGRPARVRIRASDGKRPIDYRFPATVGEGVIRADLGAYGRISVVFRPTSGELTVGRPGCTHRLSWTQGYYEGTISFHDKGVTGVTALRALGGDGYALSVGCAGQLESSSASGSRS